MVFNCLGPNAVPSSVFVPIRKGTLRNLPVLSWIVADCWRKSPSMVGLNDYSPVRTGSEIIERTDLPCRW